MGVKCHAVRKLSKEEILNQLTELKKELAEVIFKNNNYINLNLN